MGYLSICLGWLYWNPERTLFTIPIINHPVVWYGLWFALGFIAGYILLIPIFMRQLSQTTQLPNTPYRLKDLALFLVDRLTWFMVAGTLIGARLGHVFLYDWPYYKNNLSEIFKIWHGGLASHGGALGILIGLFLYQRTIRKQFPVFSFIALLDIIAVPTALVACCIRIGNFFNQEILGPPTTVPWAIIFGDPVDGGALVPRHPAQLYEAFAYLCIFVILWSLWYRHSTKLKQGMLSGLFFIMLFGSRFALEFFKVPQSMIIDESFLQMGQYLSIPFIIAGIFLCTRPVHCIPKSKNEM